MFYKNWPYWLKGGVAGLIIGLIGAYPIGMLVIFILMLFSPDALNFVLSCAVNLIPKYIYDSSSGLAVVAVANLGLMLVLIIVSTCIGIIIAEIKHRK
jgi:hypothetical protein